MKNKMNLFKIIFGFIAISILLPFASVACSDNSNPLSDKQPRYILSGSEAASDTYYQYYDIGNDQYAIGLKEAYKNSDIGTINIPLEYNSIPVTGIWRNGFAGCKSTSISFAVNSNNMSNITVIDYEAFLGCSINQITIPCSVKQIGSAAFYGCTSLTSVTFNNSSRPSTASSSGCLCEESGEEYTYSSLKIIPDFCFFDCSTMKRLLLPSSIEEIGYEAFNGCVSLTSTLSFQNIRTIKSRAFQGCQNLTAVYLPSKFFLDGGVMGTMGDHVFTNCNAIASMNFYFAGTESDVTAWVNANPDWGLYSDITADAYNYTLTNGDTYYSDDWIYSSANGEVTLSSYIGPTNVDFISIPDHLPLGSENEVCYIDADALLTVKSTLKRLYLPTTLKRIGESYFANYSNLSVIKSNMQCETDYQYLQDNPSGTITPAVDLGDVTGLEVIDRLAFCVMPKASSIKILHLPYSLKALGDQVFGRNNGARFSGVTSFKWDYKEGVSQLEVIGHEAFYKLGLNYKASGGNFNDTVRQERVNSSGDYKYDLTTIVFPKTLTSFGYSQALANKYGVTFTSNTNPAHVFAGCPLISKVIFKGSDDTNETCDLVITIQSFVFCESLRTIIFEERNGHYITFHTENGKWNEPAIGSNAGRNSNDFYGEPFLQTLVLPNKTTNLVFQHAALQGNSRAAMYLTSTMGDNMYLNDTQSSKSVIENSANGLKSEGSYTQASMWNSIGSESFYEKGTNSYIGYCLTSSLTSKSTYIANSFSLEQNMPYYENVHYYELLEEEGILNASNEASVEVEVGSGNTNDLVISDKCAFVTNNSTNEATMSKYLYDRYDRDFSGTAIIPTSVNNIAGTSCTVTGIGESAFSACFCDGKYNYPSGYFKDLSAVLMPDSIETIGNFAFLRAYGINNIYSYASDPNSPHANYVMPSSLLHIGKEAFAFTAIPQVLNIPDNCLFFENENDTTNECSVFVNCLSLRKVTFGTSGTTSNSNYVTSTYTSNGGDTYTGAIYSTNAVSHNPDCLLIILNRDSVDYNKESGYSAYTDYTSGGSFNGQLKTNASLFGAYKMASFIKSLTLSNAKTDANGTAIAQALFSAIKAGNYLYLKRVNSGFTNDGSTPTLESVQLSSSLTSLPSYAFEGCGNLSSIVLPYSKGATLPAGLFSKISGDLTIRVPKRLPVGDEELDPADDNDYKDCESGILDLTYTGYAELGEEVFSESSLFTKIIAPITLDGVTGFTIGNKAFYKNTALTEVDCSNVTGKLTVGTYAFYDCNNLTTVNFSNATNELRLNQYAFSDCENPSFSWPASTKVKINEFAFAKSKFTSFTLPTGAEYIGRSAFQECTNLTTVTADADLTRLTHIYSEAFYKCSALTNFDFSHFVALKEIYSNAFKPADNTNNSATISANGIVELPATLTKIGEHAFQFSKLTKLIINSSTIYIDKEAFVNCKALTHIYFTNTDCKWEFNTSKYDAFSYCDNLVEVWLPNNGTDKFNYNNNMPHSYFWVSTSAKIYTRNKLVDIPSYSTKWREHTSGQYNPIVYKAETSADCLNNGAIYTSNPVFWYGTGYDSFIYLGKVVSVSDGVVTFETGYTLDASGNLN